MSAPKKMRELNRARIEHDKSRLMAGFAESRNEMVNMVDAALAGKVEALMQQLASRDEEVAELKRKLNEPVLLSEWQQLEKERDQLREQVTLLRDRAKRLVDNAEWGVGGCLSDKSKARDIPSRAGSWVKTRHLASLRDALADTEPKEQEK